MARYRRRLIPGSRSYNRKARETMALIGLLLAAVGIAIGVALAAAVAVVVAVVLLWMGARWVWNKCHEGEPRPPGPMHPQTATVPKLASAAHTVWRAPNALSVPPKIDYAGAVRAFCRRTGVLNETAALWMAPIIEAGDVAGDDYEKVGRALRGHGELASTEEKKAAGVNPRLKIGKPFLSALTDKGRIDPARAASAAAHWPMSERGRATQRALIEESGGVGRTLILDDDKTCFAARRLKGVRFRPGQVPVFPLHQCDQLMCRCSFQRDFG